MNELSNEHTTDLSPDPEWCLVEEAYDDKDNQRKESLFSLGNGYFGMRGYFE